MIQVERSITIDRPRHEIYAFWRTFSQLPQFMEHLVSVSGDADGVSHWTAKAPIGTVEWDAKVVEDKPDEMISWRSLDDADVKNSGAVRFFDAGNGGTEVVVNLTYDPPAGAIGKIVAKLFGEEPDQQVRDDLERLKQILESREMADDGERLKANDGDVDDHAVAGTGMATGGTGVENLSMGAGVGLGGAGAAITRGPDFVPGVGRDLNTEDNLTDRRGLKTGADNDPVDLNDRDVANRNS